MADEKREVVITDIKMPFWSMVTLLVEWTVAAIPAVIILYVVAAVLSMALHAIFGSGLQHWWMGPSA